MHGGITKRKDARIPSLAATSRVASIVDDGQMNVDVCTLKSRYIEFDTERYLCRILSRPH